MDEIRSREVAGHRPVNREKEKSAKNLQPKGKANKDEGERDRSTTESGRMVEVEEEIQVREITVKRHRAPLELVSGRNYFCRTPLPITTKRET